MLHGYEVPTKSWRRAIAVMSLAASFCVAGGSSPAVAGPQQLAEETANASLSNPPGGGAGSTQLMVQVSRTVAATTLNATWTTYSCVDNSSGTQCSYTERDVTGATPTAFDFATSSKLRPPSFASVTADVTYEEIQWTCTTTDVSHSCTPATPPVSGTTHIDLAWVTVGRTMNSKFTGASGQRYVQHIALASVSGEAFGVSYTPEGSAGSSLGTTVAV